MRVYVATGFENKALHSAATAALKASGHHVTYDWTGHTQAEEPAEVARVDMAGVLAADAVIVLLPGKLGTHCELGIALGAGIPVLVWSQTPEAFEKPAAWACPFYHSNGVTRAVGSMLWIMRCIATEGWLDAMFPLEHGVRRAIAAMATERQ